MGVLGSDGECDFAVDPPSMHDTFSPPPRRVGGARVRPGFGSLPTSAAVPALFMTLSMVLCARGYAVAAALYLAVSTVGGAGYS